MALSETTNWLQSPIIIFGMAGPRSPSVGPRNAAERTARAQLESALLSSHYSVGWVISLDKQLCDNVDDVYKTEAKDSFVLVCMFEDGLREPTDDFVKTLCQDIHILGVNIESKTRQLQQMPVFANIVTDSTGDVCIEAWTPMGKTYTD